MKWMLLVILFCIVVLGGCEDRFRYPCQDPRNWETQDCKPPLCSATGTCPNDLVPPAKVSQ